MVPGIITAASKTQIKATIVVVKCRDCGHEKSLKLSMGFAGVGIPRACDKARETGPDK